MPNSAKIQDPNSHRPARLLANHLTLLWSSPDEPPPESGGQTRPLPARHGGQYRTDGDVHGGERPVSKHFSPEPERTTLVVAHPRFSEDSTGQSFGGRAKELWNGLTTRKPDQWLRYVRHAVRLRQSHIQVDVGVEREAGVMTTCGEVLALPEHNGPPDRRREVPAPEVEAFEKDSSRHAGTQMLSICFLDPAVSAQPVVRVEDERRLGTGAQRRLPSFEQAGIVNVAVIEDGDQFRLRQGDSATNVRSPPPRLRGWRT